MKYWFYWLWDKHPHFCDESNRCIDDRFIFFGYRDFQAPYKDVLMILPLYKMIGIDEM